MANEQNLRPAEYKLSVEEAKKGGIKSGETRRRKADLRKALETLLQGKTPNGTTYEENVALGLMQNAIDSKSGGNPKAFEVIAKMIGQYNETEQTEAPSLKIEIIDNETKIKGE